MVKLMIDKETRISSDCRQWMLQKKKGNAWSNISFYVSLEHLLQSYVEQGLLCSDAESFQTLLNEKNALLKQLNCALHPLRVRLVSDDKQ